MTLAVLSLGSNLGDSLKILKDAVSDIKDINGISNFKMSPFYRTKPVGYLDQDDFINLACSFETSLEPLDILHKMQALEQKYKRVRLFRNGPRTLDIDLIIYGDEIINTEELIVPHPRMHERAFVLAPLRDIEPDLIVSTFNASVLELYEKLAEKEKSDVELING
ncbi:2-amino-4-hydroxy-6-hydroxymethyldihydropteridinediphosphokinase [Succinivibrio dextrinosolvens]|uniref:2-amino-4-hydroxy-6- hydroxymethyldihydropteridine diphosphokinase n=1 Tax=Succinivibrio dextrinosolvens TaxID=83771 RepID=UPI0008EDB37E|nr:2-amino-4-hydroxy-6-hydroxymethyldihydropteridine diphosphokinase [Succinivibrio dextrinosolvens]SFS36434.1 2-amino-4-hydroxy-6-hydroxymethyldihydropteridinediphosphokinase [Succinivibrio dextrinosolvens]